MARELPYHVPYHRWTPAEVMRLVSLAGEGKTYAEIAKAMRLPNYCVRDKLGTLTRQALKGVGSHLATACSPAAELTRDVMLLAVGHR